MTHGVVLSCLSLSLRLRLDQTGTRSEAQDPSLPFLLSGAAIPPRSVKRRVSCRGEECVAWAWFAPLTLGALPLPLPLPRLDIQAEALQT